MSAPAAHALTAYAHNGEYLADELAKLDLLFASMARALQLEHKDIDADGNAHLYISDAEAERLLRPAPADPAAEALLDQAGAAVRARQRVIDARIAESRRQGVYLALPALADIFRLGYAECQALLVCLAPELDRKYDRVYAYLQDDITRKRASVDLVLRALRVLQPEAGGQRNLFAAGAPLLRIPMVQALDDAHSPSGCSDLARMLKLESRVLDFILGYNTVDPRLGERVSVHAPEDLWRDLPIDGAAKEHCLRVTRQTLAGVAAPAQPLVWHLHGPNGAGRRDLARAVCGQLRCPLLCLDLDLLMSQEPDPYPVLRLLLREAALWQGAVCLENADGLLAQETDRATAASKLVARALAESGWLTFLTGTRPGLAGAAFDRLVLHELALPMADVPTRAAVWRDALLPSCPDTAEAWATDLAGRFRLTPGQIRRVVRTLAADKPALTDIYKVCRGQSRQTLGELAVKLAPRRTWGDLVLTDALQSQLREICAQVKHAYTVFGDWGFGERLHRGKGLSVLLSGPPGTGKTLAAEVMAGELALDLYKIDLSCVVSKYIGETEKNLARIFREAQDSNAILFFDEADALFGKRTEVASAHDRYANIETSYLLQKMEEYEGMVMLATNLRSNMDDAFVRRLRFIVEFPFPDAAARERIWAAHLPRSAPLAPDLDCALLARQFQVAGGYIRNIVLNAAFLAADSGGVIRMEHLVRGAHREFEKIGKSFNPPEPRADRVARRRE